MTPLAETLQNSFIRSFGLYKDLAQSLDETTLSAKLPDSSSNTIGLQLWCVIGARESYSKAIHTNEWSGFSCSLKKPYDKKDVLVTLAASEATVMKSIINMDSFSEIQSQLAIDLLEHECQHHGQLIRYIYALKLDIPESWKKRYALS